jgi:predicted N-acyltransferase
VRVAVLQGVRDVAPEAWDALVGEDGSPFLEWAWLSALEESEAASAETGWLPQHLTLWDGDRLVGACPLYVKAHSRGEFVFDHGWATAAERAGIPYYPKLLVGVPFTPAAGARFLAAAADRPRVIPLLASAIEDACRSEGFSSAHVNFCLPDEVEALAARGWLRRIGYQYQWRNAGFGSFDDYLASLRSKRRNQVRREQRELGEQGITIEALAGDAIPDALFPRMFDLYRRTVNLNPWGQQYLERATFDLLRERFRRRLCFIVARRGGKVIAGTFNVEKAGVFYGRYWGTERDVRHLHFNVCYYAAIAHAVARGHRRFEPGAGGEFKQLRGFDPVATDSMHFLVEPRLRNAVRDFLARERRAVGREIAWLDERSALRRDRPGPEEPEEPA